MSRHSYFYQGREISEQAALDHHGLLRDGVSVRVSAMMRDSDAAARDARTEAYRQYDREMGQMYKLHGSLRDTPTPWAEAPSGAGSNGPLGVGKRDSAAKFHDGTPDGGANRPGWRIPLNDDKRRAVVQDAYQQYERELTNRWRLGDQERTCSECDGGGEDEAGNDCPVCGGEGVLPAANETTDTQTAHASLAQRNDDSRPLAQRMQDHKRTMDALYRARDAELENAWRNK